MTANRKLYDELRAGLDTLSADDRERIRLEPGTTAHHVDDWIEFRAAGITYASVDRSFFDSEVEWNEFVAAHTE
ncbi:hypothetical protein CH249_15365 [Rhodococcus sp. 05-2255-3B1]|uniref:hypothetical protein n=1 Tax=unclassified Rhodococcus (in: high G+C Gram-positive bacteria) TaxID=192944 RepID=UPI000B9B4A71|nr:MULTISPECIES: hypothetical protein [unclassified Rhodococcus (in: high G+C Gram-positive bacteria)]OZE03169.1 hypothetical protein CH250_23430 [Rhodococcus sp. 05-2255-3C]OZE09558.1 hypothetical protein CH249_15365 [Rhodococcus sp. 05-2255-3B1]OZE14824.1 hypothetical protein CH255_21710 [Rhodococcus sp. 05-2255-2A2]